MAAVERVLVAQGWHLPRWRTSNKDYGKFYQHRQRPAHASKEPLQHLNVHHPPHLHHVVDYINCSDRCRPLHLRQHPTSVDMPPVSSSCRENASLGPPFVRSCGPGLNAHIEHLTLQEERSPMMRAPEQLPCMQSRDADDSRDASSLDERPPWKPKPLKPMILFEKYGQALYKKPKMFKHKKNQTDVD